MCIVVAAGKGAVIIRRKEGADKAANDRGQVKALNLDQIREEAYFGPLFYCIMIGVHYEVTGGEAESEAAALPPSSCCPADDS